MYPLPSDAHAPLRSRRRIIAFARAPELGCVKTRLAADVGQEMALSIYRWLGERTVAAVRAVPFCEMEVRYTPADRADAVTAWLGNDIALHPQSEGDLGTRMRSAIDDALADGCDSVVVVGTDCPALDTSLLVRAFTALHASDIVIGPALDGGYYLLGVNASHPSLFENIPWSSPETLTHTLTAAREAGLVVDQLDAQADIDTGDDWRRWLMSGATATLT